jgi:hypothetical protein
VRAVTASAARIVCRLCGLAFKTTTGRDRHEKVVHADYDALSVEENRRRAVDTLLRLYGLTASPEERVEGGPCDECAAPALRRYRYGRFALCRSCVTSRRQVAALMAEAA